MAMKLLSNVLTCWKNSLKVFKDFTYFKEHFQKFFCLFCCCLWSSNLRVMYRVYQKNKNKTYTLKQLDLWKIAK